MGVIYSQLDYKIEIQGDEQQINEINDAATNISNQALRLPLPTVRNIVSYYLKYKLPPLLDFISLHGFFQSCDQINNKTNGLQDVVYVLWKIFSFNSTCYLQDVIVCLILICEGTWYERLSLLYDMFKCRGTEEVSYEDIMMIIQISSVSMFKLWNSETDWKQSEMNRLGEALADEAYSKLEKELDNGISKEEFLNWAQERFKSSRSVASPESLVKLLTSQYDI